ncbi:PLASMODESMATA CALLOSE-BINDING PROTEIN 2 isoform X2 [Zea mays]|uniref:Carbohydrate-binding X8 domain superfamily protein n=1 Tax=Zea mays TaxID=4577 RepID=A0A1D6FL65_MAIZE|nr:PLASMODESMATA CALLOSE-BINDING PROTEIN 2 isoform X2 [Zea mays]AQK92438.1 Carbohydrate-binding X8 domain superfamily protein [Zea mays]|eukprot:XP_008656072.1 PLASMODESMATA CALLOSE-BINDING PROTEIN 2 isoform X2 [Zea mays]
MPLRPVHGFASLLVIFACHCHGGGSEQGADVAAERLERDVTSPLATVPVVDPTAAAAATTTQSPATGGSWCVASPSASATALRVALDYACGQGGADCSAIQQGGSCFSPDTVRDHASYAFNSYYQKNPVQTSCDFGGTAALTTADPSTSTCQYPSTSTGASVLNTSTPLTPTNGSPPGPGYGSSPPAGYANSPPLYGNMSPPDYGDNISAAARALPGRKTTATAAVASLATTCLLTAALSLTVSG